MRNRVRARGECCHICGRPIDYSLTTWTDPRDNKVKPHPYRFEVDELIPVSRWREGGYQSAQACALDPKNVKAAHRICNQRRGNKSMAEVRKVQRDGKTSYVVNGHVQRKPPKVEKKSREW